MELSQRKRALVGRLCRRKTRVREGLVLVEGVRCVSEALDAGAEVRFAVCSARAEAVPGGAAVVARIREAAIDLAEVDEQAFEELSDTERSQGVLLVCVEPRPGMEIVRPGGRYLVLDAIQDPGNVGTLIRAAVAFALDGVIALDGTVDPWGAKAVRASAGMVFRLPLISDHAEAVAANLESTGVPVLVADAAGDDVAEADGGDGWALVVGNEGAGPRGEMKAEARDRVRIPMPGDAESLNAGVAGAILLYELTKETIRA